MIKIDVKYICIYSINILDMNLVESSDIYVVQGYLNNYGFCVSLNKISKKILHFIKIYFNVTPQSNYEEPDENTKEKSFDVFFSDDNYIVLPKFVPKLQLNLKNPIEIDNISYKKIIFQIKKFGYKKTVCDFSFNGKMRDNQNIVINSVFEKFGLDPENPDTSHSASKTCKGGILKLGCGIGKTNIAIYLSHKLKLKTLVIVHKEFLMDQWIERYKGLTNAKIGIIRQDKVDTKNKDVVIGMLQSISMKDYDQEIFNEFGFVVYDEVHHVASKVFSQALMKTSAEYTLGLSATPERSDGLFKVIKWHIGDILYTMEKKIDYRVLVKKIYFRSEDILFKEKKRWFQGRMAPNHTSMIDNLAKIQSRNKIIINMINTLKNLGRKILILSYRVEHLVKLKSMIDLIIQNDGEQHIYNTYFYMGDTKKGERRMAEKDGDIIFATMQLAEEGLDIAHLDTILFALPVSIQKEKGTSKKFDKTLIQSIGRILRNDKLNELTQIPLVVDITDLLSIYQGWSKKRDEVYDKKNWYIQSYHYSDSDYVFTSDQQTDKNPMNIIFDDITDEEFIEKNLITTQKEIEEKELDSESSDNISNNTELSIKNSEYKQTNIPEDIFTKKSSKSNKKEQIETNIPEDIFTKKKSCKSTNTNEKEKKEIQNLII